MNKREWHCSTAVGCHHCQLLAPAFCIPATTGITTAYDALTHCPEIQVNSLQMFANTDVVDFV
jgi:hypothetical protein